MEGMLLQFISIAEETLKSQYASGGHSTPIILWANFKLESTENLESKQEKQKNMCSMTFKKGQYYLVLFKQHTGSCKPR